MTLRDWTGKTVEEASKEINSLKEELFHLRLKKSTSQLEKGHRLREVRRQIARGNTYVNQQRGARS